MTHASLSPELDKTLSVGSLKDRAAARAGIGPEASLWLLALTSLTLVFASLLLFGLLAQGVASDGYVNGFATAIATITGGLGLVVMGYVVLVAHRAGYLARPREEGTTSQSVAPPGLRVAPAVPAGLAYRKRQQRTEQRAERRKQARAIDSVELDQQARHAPARPPLRTQAVQAPPSPKVVPPQPPTAPTRPAPARPAAAARARVRPPARPQPRPVARPAASSAFLRLNPPRVRPRGQAALLQVGAASVRAPFVPPRPHPVLPGFAPRA